jgi:hypothetical protein
MESGPLRQRTGLRTSRSPKAVNARSSSGPGTQPLKAIADLRHVCRVPLGRCGGTAWIEAAWAAVSWPGRVAGCEPRQRAAD